MPEYEPTPGDRVEVVLHGRVDSAGYIQFDSGQEVEDLQFVSVRRLLPDDAEIES
jgi:hypothetical protein